MLFLHDTREELVCAAPFVVGYTMQRVEMSAISFQSLEDVKKTVIGWAATPVDQVRKDVMVYKSMSGAEIMGCISTGRNGWLLFFKAMGEPIPAHEDQQGKKAGEIVFDGTACGGYFIERDGVVMVQKVFAGVEFN